MILLTGGTGFAGRHLAMQLVADARHVRVLSRTPGRVVLPDGISWARGDLADPVALRAALRDVRTVVHAAAVVPGARTPESVLQQVNVDGMANLARIARATGARQFIHISSAGIYGDGSGETPHQESDTPVPANAYERSKLSAERALAATLDGSAVHWTILRPQGLYAADRPATAAFFRAVARRRIWLHGPARVIVHPTHVTDLVSAVRRVIERGDLHQETINVGGARALEFRELIALIGARVGHVPRSICAPRWAGRLAALALQASAAVGKRPALLARMSRAWVNRSVSTEKCRRLLGFEPVSLEWGLDDTAAELRRQGLL